MSTRSTILTGVALLTLVASTTPATAATLVVDQQSGPYTTISEAVGAARPGDVIDVHAGRYAESVGLPQDDVLLSARPGATLENPFDYAGVYVSGRGVTVAGLTVTSTRVGIDVRGEGTVIRDTTVVTAGTALQVIDAGRTRVERSVLHGTAPQGPGLVLASTGDAAQHVTVTSSLIVGGEGIHPVEYDTTDGSSGPLVLDLVFSTLHSPSGWSPFTKRRQDRPGQVVINAYNSILHTAGDPDGQLDGGVGNDLAGADAQTFTDAANGDFHLRADAPVLGRAVALPPGVEWPQTDLAGLPRQPGTASPGAYELPNRPPSAVLSASAASVRQGTPARFDASGSVDPDPGGRVARYAWSFGDGTPDVTTTAPIVEHVYATTGPKAATVATTDQFGASATSAPVSIEVTDGLAPTLRVISPRAGSRRHATRAVKRRGKRLRVLNPLKVAGRTADAGGVARVDVQLKRGTVTFASKGMVKGGAFAWHSPARSRLARGRWTLTVIATDRAGNVARAVVPVTITR